MCRLQPGRPPRVCRPRQRRDCNRPRGTVIGTCAGISEDPLATSIERWSSIGTSVRSQWSVTIWTCPTPGAKSKPIKAHAKTQRRKKNSRKEIRSICLIHPTVSRVVRRLRLTLLCGFATLREIFILHDQLFRRGETVGDAGDTVADQFRAEIDHKSQPAIRQP